MTKRLVAGLLALHAGGLAHAEITSGPARSPVLKTGDWAALHYDWNKPSPKNSYTGAPIGNSHVGARVNGGIGVETLQLNEKTFWSGEPVEGQDPSRRKALEASRKKLAEGDIPGGDKAAEGMWGPNETGMYLPLGSLRLAFAHGDKADGYRRTLDLDRGAVTVTYKIGGVTYTRECFASYPDNVIVVRITADKPGAISFDAAFTLPEEMKGHQTTATLSSDTLTMSGQAPELGAKWNGRGISFHSLLRVIPTGGSLVRAGNSLSLKNADGAVLIFSCATNFAGPFVRPGDSGIKPEAVARATLDAASKRSAQELLDRHLADHRALFRRFSLELNGSPAQRHAFEMQYARYDMIASSRDGDRPHNQEGMWNHTWKTPNYCSHFLNENVEKHYSIIETTNIAQTGDPLWNWMDELAKSGAKTAAIDWGFRGWLAPHATDNWAVTTLRGGDNEYAVWPLGGAWLCQNLWEHYAYAKDMTFLKERAYPLMKGAALFCLDYLVDDGHGRLVSSPSTSPEHKFKHTDGKFYAVSRGCTGDLAIIGELFKNCVEASEILGVDPEFRETLKAAKAKMLPYQIGAKGALQEWSQDFEEREPSHRHASHILSVWPLTQITERATPELFEAAKKSLILRGRGAYHPDAAAMWARLHEGDRALSKLGGPRAGIATEWCPRYAGLPEMLLYSHNRSADGGYELELLPALPGAWKSGKVAGLRARGGYELELEWADGKLVKAVIDSPYGTIPAIRYAGALLDAKTDARIVVNRVVR